MPSSSALLKPKPPERFLAWTEAIRQNCWGAAHKLGLSQSERLEAIGLGADEPALFLALRYRAFECAQRLLALPEITPNDASFSGSPILASAINLNDLGQGFDKSRVDFVIALLEAGADPNAPMPNTGNTPLILCARGGSPSDAIMARALLDHGASVSQANFLGETPLISCLAMPESAEEAAKLARLFAQRGARVEETDHKGRSASFLAGLFLREEQPGLIPELRAIQEALDMAAALPRAPRANAPRRV